MSGVHHCVQDSIEPTMSCLIHRVDSEGCWYTCTSILVVLQARPIVRWDSIKLPGKKIKGARRISAIACQKKE